MGSDDGMLARRQAVLSAVTLFRQLPPVLLERLAAAVVPLTFGAGAVIVHEGLRADYLYVIVAGEVELRREGEPAGTRGPGEWFGATPVQGLTAVARTATSLYALETAELAAVARADG